MPRFSLGDVGEARWLLSHRWTDTSPILPDAAHDSGNQGRVVSLSVLSLLSVCVRLCQLREVGSSQFAASAESLVTDAERSNRQVICLLHIIVGYACVSCSGCYPLNPPCVHCLCCSCTNSGACGSDPIPGDGFVRRSTIGMFS